MILTFSSLPSWCHRNLPPCHYHHHHHHSYHGFYFCKETAVAYKKEITSNHLSRSHKSINKNPGTQVDKSNPI
jgi:hypothetical protein